MIRKQEIKQILKYERLSYGINFKSAVWGCIVKHRRYRIWKWLYLSRMYDYYSQFSERGVFWKIVSLYYLRRRNSIGEKMGFDIDTKNIGKGLIIYHFGATVINGSAIIGENCILHGNNCIGNKGPLGSPCPIIGNNVEIGVGAKVIGGVTIADNITIGAGAVVVHSFNEKGIIIGGVPAKKIPLCKT